MGDNLESSNGQDRKRIDVNQSYELRDWSKKFGVSPDALKEAVKAVGRDASKVDAHLKASSEPGQSGAEKR